MLARRLRLCLLAATALVLLASCSLTSEPEAPPHLEFSEPMLDLGTLREGQIELRNTGGQAVGPVELLVSGVRDADGATVPGSHLMTAPQEIPTLKAGAARTLTVSLSVQGSLIPGEYDAAIGQLESLLAVPSITAVPMLRIDPVWDPIREHPRFQALLAKHEN